VKYWEIIADRLSKAGWSLGWVSAIHGEGRTIWIVDAHGCGNFAGMSRDSLVVGVKRNRGASVKI